MINAKDLLLCLCNEHNYRFYAGKEKTDLDILKNYMSKDMLHYIPTVSTKNAFGLALGVSLTGFGAAVILDIKDLALLYNYIKDLVNTYKQPLLFLVGYNNDEELSEYKKMNKGVKTLILDDSYNTQLKKNKNTLRLVFIRREELQ